MGRSHNYIAAGLAKSSGKDKRTLGNPFVVIRATTCESRGVSVAKGTTHGAMDSELGADHQ